MPEPRDPTAIIIGAGPAGIATAACLKRRGIPFVLLEQRARVGSAWHNHYERLHLHTARNHSSLPFTPFPTTLPTYVPRADVVAYLEDYARQHDLEPVFGVEVQRVSRDGDSWLVEAEGRQWRAPHVVMTTGTNRVPRVPTWPDRDLFRGRVLHSREFKSGRDFKGKRVLVVGAGNSGAEIALDLCEQGAITSICIRGPINVVPRDVLGIPAQVIGIHTSWQPRAWADRSMRLLSHLLIGDLRRWGIQRKDVGPLRQISEEGAIPLIDIGTIARIKAGEIAVVPGIERFTDSGVRCVDGAEHALDAVVLATGYTTGLAAILADSEAVLDGRGLPRVYAPACPAPGLHFVGFANVSTGLLREIGRHAQAVAEVIAGGQIAPR